MKLSKEGKNIAPGPDSLHKNVLTLALRVFAEPTKQLMNSCLKRGVFLPV